jgi:ketosteroid isomerase-like protein
MSRENVEAVRAMCEAYNEGDIEGALAKLHPDVEWHGTVGGVDEGQVFRGHREVIEAFVESAEAWESQTLEMTRFIDAGDRVVVFWHEVARGRKSGAEVETETAVIYTVKDGAVVRVDPYMSRDQALDVLGISDG